MASSPTSSSYSLHAPPFGSSSPEFPELPIKSLRSKIVEKIQENRVTLIVGETGCGKSSQVPQYLLEENMEPILCTQPRRFAVVAVARMVAEARNSEVGAEVGYHIGRSKVASASSKIMFKTAGVLLEEMRDKGLKALDYKVIILDEVHERSAESDLVLVCVKQFLLKNNDLRVVLMSATADIARYKDYFKDLGRGERVEVLAIPSSSQHAIYQRRVSYLEQVASLVGISSESLSSTYCSGPNRLLASAIIKPELHKLIHELVLHIHKNEPDIEKSILVFLPTYFSLEQQWFLLKPFSACFKVHILHSSIDTEQALMAMRISKSHRKVILATNIAESSVTIPKVAFVIDSCRSLHVSWNADRKADTSVLSWASKSQAEQRRGRTGRTCDGEVYRLVPGSFFSQLEDFECPAILRLSLRQQVLLICCAGSKVISDPKVLLQKALDPPDADVVKDALDMLLHVGALERTSPRGRYEPTFYGRLLASFSLSFDASMLILKFGEMGMLREGILLGVLMDTQPLPILRPFGQEQLSAEYTDQYYSGESMGTTLTGRTEVSLVANLCAFQFWQRVYKDNRRLERLRQLSNTGEKKAEAALVPQLEDEWCLFHNVVQSSLNHVAEAYEDILDSVHRYRPKFLSSSDGLPVYYEPYEFQHTCETSEDAGKPSPDDDALALFTETKKCISTPFVPSNTFQSHEVAETLATIIREIRTQCMVSASANEHTNANGYVPQVYWDTGSLNPVCKFFVQGLCTWGSECRFSHSLVEKRPPCMFFFTLKGCRNGDSCLFSHELDQSKATFYQPSLCLPEDGIAYSSSLLRLFPRSSDTGLVLVLDDVDLHFSSSLSNHYDPSKIISTTSLSGEDQDNPPPTGIKVIWGVSQPCQTIISKAADNPIPWSKVKCVLWSLKFDRDGENTEVEKVRVRTFFESLAARVLTDGILEVQVILTINNIRFCQLQVEKLGRESFFFLRESFPFDESSFGKLSDSISWKRPMVASRPVSYVFDLNPPSADYATAFHKPVVCYP